MSRKAIIVLVVVSALNVIGLAINISPPSKAAVGGMNHHELTRDPDFTRAVKAIVQECRVNVDVARLDC